MVTHILLIDDDRDNHEIFCEALERLTVSTVCYMAISGAHAFEILKSTDSPLPDIIFLDINMPKMSGWECLQLLKSNEAYKNIPVIMCSTSTYDVDREKSLELGALCFFTKPFEFTNLVAGIEMVMEHLHEDKLPLLASHSGMFV